MDRQTHAEHTKWKERANKTFDTLAGLLRQKDDDTMFDSAPGVKDAFRELSVRILRQLLDSRGIATW